MKQEITKKKYKQIVWATLIIGIIVNEIISYFFINSGVNENQMRIGLYLSLAGMIIGFAIGLSYAYTYKFKEEIK